MRKKVPIQYKEYRANSLENNEGKFSYFMANSSSELKKHCLSRWALLLASACGSRSCLWDRSV